MSSVVVSSEVGGHTLTLYVNSVKLTLSIDDAYKVAHYLSIALDKLVLDKYHPSKESEDGSKTVRLDIQSVDNFGR